MTGSLSQTTIRAQLRVVTSPAHSCGYLANREATTIFIDPAEELRNIHYTRLSEIGFRRSGAYLYKPACSTCAECVPVRMPVADYHPNRRERRINTRNQDLTIQEVANDYQDEHFRLYRTYISKRHPGGGMDTPDTEPYRSFISCPWGDTRLHEFRQDQQLLAVTVTDYLAAGLSAVYTFFDPDEQRRSLGTYAILWQIREASRLQLDWLYLGYWIKDSEKMRYKGDFRPLQAYLYGRWTDLPPR